MIIVTTLSNLFGWRCAISYERQARVVIAPGMGTYNIEHTVPNASVIISTNDGQRGPPKTLQIHVYCKKFATKRIIFSLKERTPTTAE